MTLVLDMLRASPGALAAVCALLGLMVGSFLNVVIHRLPRMMEREWHEQCAELRGEKPAPQPRYNIMTPRSACPACGHGITALENIPVVSWLALRGRCRACGTGISVRYPLVELLTAGLSGLVAWHFGWGLALAGALAFSWAMVALSFIDLDTTLLPDDITLPLLWLGLLLNLRATYVPLGEAVMGAVAGYLALWSVYWGFKLLTGKEGMGYGDFKLLAAIGAFLGWKMLPLVILLSACAGAAIGIGLIVFARHGRQVPIPFGPYLAIAGMVALLWGPTLTTRYLDLYR